MPQNPALEKIKKGIGMEDAQVRKYITDKAEKRLSRMQTYQKVDQMVSQVIKEKSAKAESKPE